MSQMKKPFLSFLVAFLYLTIINGQSTIPATGGEASGTGGTSSYTIGQIVYTTHEGTTGTVAQGVQQPYEISVVTALEDVKDIDLSYSIYPNPTTDFLTLKVANNVTENMSYWLYGVNGNLLETRKLLASETQIYMGNKVSGTYFLKITSNNKALITFKIIKN